MRILFTRQFPLDSQGGEVRHLFALAREMRDMGVEVYLMPATDRPTPAMLWPREFVREVRPFGVHRILDSFPLSRGAAVFIEEKSIDAVLSWQYETAYLSTFTRSRNFVSGVVAAAPFGLLKRSGYINPARGIVFHFFHFRMLRQAQVIYCASSFAKAELVKYIGVDPLKIVVAPLGVDDIFQPCPDTKSGPLRNFIFSGAFIPLKGIFDAIAALGILRQRGVTNWVFKIAGWGNENAVRRAARRRGIESQIQFFGPLDQASLATELAHADLAILPSHTETFGLSIAEAQACGIPVVCYRAGAIPEVVREGKTALLADALDTAQLADAIIQLINNPDEARQMGQRGSRFIRENFSWRKTAEKMVETIDMLRSPKP